MADFFCRRRGFESRWLDIFFVFFADVAGSSLVGNDIFFVFFADVLGSNPCCDIFFGRPLFVDTAVDIVQVHKVSRGGS